MPEASTGPAKAACEGPDMSRVSPFSSPFLLGFDEIERVLDRVAKNGAEAYPPYNLERLPGREGRPETLRITLAVAGFRRDQLEATVEHNQLTIRGQQGEEAERSYLHRGIAARRFQRTFVLADGMEVTGAELKNGLLSIDLARPNEAKAARRIDIACHE